LCFESEYKTGKFYFKDPLKDIPLGRYLLLKVANIDKKCLQCGRPKYKHNSIFYYGRCMVRIEVVESKFNVNRALMSMLDEHIEDNPASNIVVTKEKLQMQLK
jgi:hypothetical protein